MSKKELNEDFLIDEEKAKPEKKISKEEQEIIDKKTNTKRYIISFIINFIIAGLAFVFVLIWQMRFDLLGFSNVFSVTFLIMFFIAWIMFVYNKNVFSPLIHGLKVFGLMFVGKRSKESYYEYTVRISENPIPKYVYYPTFITAGVLFIPALILVILAS